MSVTFSNTVFTNDQSATGLIAFDRFTGTDLLSGPAPVTINGTIDTPNSVVQVDINVAGITSVGASGTYVGFSTSPAGDYTYYFNVTGAGIVTPVTLAVTGAATLPTLAVLSPVNIGNVTAPIGPNSPCYAQGTLVRTTRGPVAVEELTIGDEIVTASGAARPVVWLGHRHTVCAGHHAPEMVLPIRIRAGAIAPGMPSRDLRVSPDHALFFDDVLVQARFLVNGSTIVRERIDTVTYWHVELETHDILFAEDLPSESYLDVGNRWAFAGNDRVVPLRPNLDAIATTDRHCAPLAVGGERLHAIRAWIADRARHLGFRTTTDTAMQLLADGAPVTPVTVEAGRFAYFLPAGAGDIRLVSRAGIPQEMLAESSDTRTLGVCVTMLEIDGVAVALDDERLDAGWHDAEQGLRWTDGEAILPPARTIVLTANGLDAYPMAAAASHRPPAFTLRMAG